MDASASGAQTRARRRQFLIDRRFQYKYTLIIVAVGVFISGVMGFFIYDLFQENTEMAIMESVMADSIQPSANAPADSFREQVGSYDSRKIYYLVAFVSLMAVALFIWGIFVTHRIAGPLFIISRYLSQLSADEVPETRPLRKRDELKDFFDVFSDALTNVQAGHLKDAELLERVVHALRESGQGPQAELAKELEVLAVRKRRWESYRSI